MIKVLSFVNEVYLRKFNTLACHPASTIHRQLTSEQLVLAGVSEDMIRISVSIEHIDDIIQDVEQAIQASMH